MHVLLLVALVWLWLGWACTLWMLIDMWQRLIHSGALTENKPVLRDYVGFFFWIVGIPLAGTFIVIAVW